MNSLTLFSIPHLAFEAFTILQRLTKSGERSLERCGLQIKILNPGAIFGLLSGEWVGEAPDPLDWIAASLPQPLEGAPGNPAASTDPTAEALLARAEATPDASQRSALLQQLEQRLLDYVDVIPLYQLKVAWVAKPYVRNYAPGAWYSLFCHVGKTALRLLGANPVRVVAGDERMRGGLIVRLPNAGNIGLPDNVEHPPSVVGDAEGLGIDLRAPTTVVVGSVVVVDLDHGLSPFSRLAG